jgi:hypothetical protein
MACLKRHLCCRLIEAYSFSPFEGDKRPLFAEPPADVSYERAGKLHCIVCKRGIRARPSSCRNHMRSKSHRKNLGVAIADIVASRAKPQPKQQQLAFSPAPPQNQQHRAAYTAITEHLASLGFPLYGAERLLTPKFLRLLERAPAPLPGGDQLRRVYLPLAVERVECRVRALLQRWHGYVALVEDETTERRSAAAACTLILASTPECFALLHVDLQHDASASAKSIATALRDAATRYGIQWRDVLAVGGDNVNANGAALRELRQLNPQLLRARCGSHSLQLLVGGFIAPFTQLADVIAAVKTYVIRGNGMRARRRQFNSAVGDGSADLFNFVATRWGTQLSCIIALHDRSLLRHIAQWAASEVTRRTPKPAAAAAASAQLVGAVEEDDDESGVPASLLKLANALRQAHDVSLVAAQARVVAHYLRPLPELLRRSQGAHQSASFSFADVAALDGVHAAVKLLRNAASMAGFKALLEGVDPDLQLSDAVLNTLRPQCLAAGQAFETKWAHNELDDTLRVAQRHSLFVPTSAVARAADEDAMFSDNDELLTIPTGERACL